MFFILSKFLDFLVNPLYWVIGLLTAALILSKQRNLLVKCGLGVLVVFTNPFIANQCMYFWERQPVLVADLKGPYDVAIIMGGFSDLTKRPKDRVYLAEAVERMTTPIMLYKMGIVRTLMPTGGNSLSSDTSDGSESKAIARALVFCGVREQDILPELNALNTHQNAVNTAAMLKALYSGKPTPKVLLVTSGFHMRRAEACFVKEGVAVTCFPVDNRSRKFEKFEFGGVFTPAWGAMDKWRYMLHEIAGIITYKITGYC